MHLKVGDYVGAQVALSRARRLVTACSTSEPDEYGGTDLYLLTSPTAHSKYSQKVTERLEEMEDLLEHVLLTYSTHRPITTNYGEVK